MNTAWQTENGVPPRQVVRTAATRCAAPCFLDFRSFSGLGGGRWFEPDPGYGC
jgi:hypothetical protein